MRRALASPHVVPCQRSRRRLQATSINSPAVLVDLDLQAGAPERHLCSLRSDCTSGGARGHRSRDGRADHPQGRSGHARKLGRCRLQALLGESEFSPERWRDWGFWAA